jgi:hypothetical protein
MSSPDDTASGTSQIKPPPKADPKPASDTVDLINKPPPDKPPDQIAGDTLHLRKS